MSNYSEQETTDFSTDDLKALHGMVDKRESELRRSYIILFLAIGLLGYFIYSNFISDEEPEDIQQTPVLESNTIVIAELTEMGSFLRSGMTRLQEELENVRTNSQNNMQSQDVLIDSLEAEQIDLQAEVLALRNAQSDTSKDDEIQLLQSKIAELEVSLTEKDRQNNALLTQVTEIQLRLDSLQNSLPQNSILKEIANLIGELTEPEEDTQEIGEGITEQQQLVLPLSEAEIEFSARITTFSVLLSSVYDGIASLSLNSQDELESFNFDFLDSLRVETGYSQRWGISQDIYKQSLRDIWNASGTRLMIATIAGHQNSIDTFSEQGIDLALIDRQLTELSLAEYKFKLFLASFSSFLDLPDVNPVEPTTPPKIEYPRRAQQRQLEGSAKLEFAIGVDGQVIEDSIQIQSTNSAFDEPSLEVISLYAYHQSEIPDYVANEMPAEWRDRIKLFGLTLAFTYALP